MKQDSKISDLQAWRSKAKRIYINQASIAAIEVLEINKWNILVVSIYCKTIVISKLAKLRL